MMARGFKPVGWVASVAAAALGCYMLSLNVASERAELAKLERNIVLAKRDIRTLQTELETRGRLQQLESWNANVLALSAPTTAQFLDNELTLARFDQREETLEQRSTVHMAAAPQPSAPNVQQKVQAPVRYASAPAAEKPVAPLVHQASLVVEEPTVQASPKPSAGESKAPASERKVSASEKKPQPTVKKAVPAEKLAKKIEAKSAKAGSVSGQ